MEQEFSDSPTTAQSTTSWGCDRFVGEGEYIYEVCLTSELVSLCYVLEIIRLQNWLDTGACREIVQGGSDYFSSENRLSFMDFLWT